LLLKNYFVVFVCLFIYSMQGEYERFEVVAIYQSGGEDVAKRRVLVLPHGGPHSTFPSGFQPLYLFFALQGYVVLLGTSPPPLNPPQWHGTHVCCYVFVALCCVV
jgi:hypothetical protein